MVQAVSQLRGNKLRSFLSLLGISIGIFCIIGVLSAVDSLEDNVRGSLEKLGNDVIYVKKWPWADVSGDWWNYVKRPNPGHADFEAIRDRAKRADLTSFHVVIGFKTIKFKSSSVERTVLIGCSQEFSEMFKIEFEKGRYFSPVEYNYGSNKIVLGYKVAEELFGSIEPIGKEVRLAGKKYEVIGVLEKAGNDLLNPLDFDDCILVSYTNARSLANLKAKHIFDTSVTVKAVKGVELSELKGEIKGILRAKHRLKPRQDDDASSIDFCLMAAPWPHYYSSQTSTVLISNSVAFITSTPLFSIAPVYYAFYTGGQHFAFPQAYLEKWNLLDCLAGSCWLKHDSFFGTYFGNLPSRYLPTWSVLIPPRWLRNDCL